VTDDDAPPQPAPDPGTAPVSWPDPAQPAEPAAPAAAPAVPAPDPKADPTPPRPPRPTGPVQYKGDDLAPDRGPGLGCFRIQLVVLVFLVVLTPLSVVWQWPAGVSALLLFIVIGLLLITGQTIIFLLRLVAADRRGRRRPLASGTKTVGELEDASAATAAQPEATATSAESEPSPPSDPEPTAATPPDDQRSGT